MIYTRSCFRLLVCLGIGLAGCAPAGEEQISQPTPTINRSASDETRPEGSEATRTVSAALGSNELGIATAALREKQNPKGEGTFVYVPQTRFSGVERFILWMVIDGKAYPLNGSTKDVTPNLPWPREAPESVWRKTGLNQYIASEAIEIVFGS